MSIDLTNLYSASSVIPSLIFDQHRMLNDVNKNATRRTLLGYLNKLSPHDLPYKHVRDNPKATGYTLDDIRGMSVKMLAKNMVGYTANIPGTRASKAQLRRVIMTMVKQIEIETTQVKGVDGTARGPLPTASLMTTMVPGDVPSLFGTLTTQRYHWDDIIRIIAKVDPLAADYKNLSKSKRRELVNKYPLFVAWYCAVRLELILKTVVVPIYGASSYVAVFEWSPTGGMAHLHYILWKKGAPRFDIHAQDLQARAAALRKAGLVAGGEVYCLSLGGGDPNKKTEWA